jgi:hypothetical protein
MTNKELDDGCMGKGIFSKDDYLPRDSLDIALGSGDPVTDRLSSLPRVSAEHKNRLLGNYSPTRVVRRPLMMPVTHGLVRDNAVIYSTHPDVPFKTTHLLMWGITTATRVVCILVGNTMVLPVNAEPVSAMLYFTHLDPNQLRDVNYVNEMTLQLQQEVDAPICSPSTSLSIVVEGPVTAIAFMGKIAI